MKIVLDLKNYRSLLAFEAELRKSKSKIAKRLFAKGLSVNDVRCFYAVFYIPYLIITYSNIDLLYGLYKCPVCLNKFVDVEKHMSVFHRITLEDQKRLKNEGLVVTEINVSHL